MPISMHIENQLLNQYQNFSAATMTTALVLSGSKELNQFILFINSFHPALQLT